MGNWDIEVVDVIPETINKLVYHGFWGDGEIELLATLLFIITGAQTHLHDTFGHG
jgi:hypothetical protein